MASRRQWKLPKLLTQEHNGEQDDEAMGTKLMTLPGSTRPPPASPSPPPPSASSFLPRAAPGKDKTVPGGPCPCAEEEWGGGA